MIQIDVGVENIPFLLRKIADELECSKPRIQVNISSRELEFINLVMQDMSTPEIAKRMFVVGYIGNEFMKS